MWDRLDDACDRSRTTAAARGDRRPGDPVARHPEADDVEEEEFDDEDDDEEDDDDFDDEDDLDDEDDDRRRGRPR